MIKYNIVLFYIFKSFGDYDLGSIHISSNLDLLLFEQCLKNFIKNYIK